jgi:hypothetical protein
MPEQFARRMPCDSSIATLFETHVLSLFAARSGNECRTYTNQITEIAILTNALFIRALETKLLFSGTNPKAPLALY